MATPFDETAYLKNKLAQLQTTGFPSNYKGSSTDTEYLKQYLKAAGFTPEQHYQQFGKSEGVSPFDEEIYLKNKLEELRITNSFPADYTGSKSDIEELRRYIASKGMTVPQHYEQFGLAEQVSTKSLGYTAEDAKKAASSTQLNELFKRYTGRPATADELETWGQQFGSEIDPTEIGLFADRFAQAGTPEELKTQLFNYSPEGAFTGAAYGGREGQVSQLANLLFSSGIRNVNQLGIRSVPIDPENPSAGLRPEYYNKETGNTLKTYGGLQYVADVAAQYDPNIRSGAWKEVVPGQNLAFGQTWEGEGSTTFNVTFDAQGRPIFNTYGNSTNDWNALPGIVKAAIIAGGGYLAAPYVGAGLASAAPGTLAAGTAANAAATGALLGGGTAALTGQDVLKGALLGGLGGYASNIIGGTQAPGLGPQTDASFLAADAAQLAAQGLSESQIAATLGASGYATGAAANLAASMATNGLDIGTMTNQLENLSQNTGLMQQNYSQGEFVAYDALGLQGAVGNDFAAIEQNLVASGVDPLVAADISQQIAFNPNITQPELASHLTNTYGNNIYDVNIAATYPTSQLPGEGGLLSNIPVLSVSNANVTGGMPSQVGAGISDADIAGGMAPEFGTNPPYDESMQKAMTPEAKAAIEQQIANSSVAGLTPKEILSQGGKITDLAAGVASVLTGSQIANLVKAGLGLAGASAAGGMLGGGVGAGIGVGDIPTQNVPQYSPEYYRAIQQYYNAYMPETPRDVATPLQQWYENKYGA